MTSAPLARARGLLVEPRRAEPALHLLAASALLASSALVLAGAVILGPFWQTHDPTSPIPAVSTHLERPHLARPHRGR